MASHKKVALITHTGSDMPLDEAAGLGITIIPDKVLFGDEEYRNMTEISSQMFYEKLAAAEKLLEENGRHSVLMLLTLMLITLRKQR